MLPYLTLMRPVNAFMSVIAVIIGGLLVAATNPTLLSNTYPLILAMASVFLITGAGNAINDYLDVESDKVNKPKRPIPAGRITRRKALIFSIIVFAIGILLAFLINWACILIAIVNSILLIIYSYSLQDRVLLGNVVVGYMVGSTFLFGGAAFGNLLLPGLLMLLAGLSTVTREIVKDLEDMEGDRKNFMKKITSGVRMKLSRFIGIDGKGDADFVMGKGRAKTVAGLCMIIAIIISPLPYILGILSFTYVIILVPTDLVFLLTIILLSNASSKKRLSRISKIIKIGMFLALIAFIFGVLF
jgi:geranylgeranylglycerol-phosphate geranylgeranyltransferase